MRKVSELGKVKPEQKSEQKKKSEPGFFRKHWMKMVGVIAVIYIGFWLKDRVDESKAQVENRVAEYCAKNPFAQSCVMKNLPTTMSARILHAGKVERLIYPEGYSLFWVGLCEEVRTETKFDNKNKVAVTLLTTALGVDSTIVNVMVQKTPNEPAPPKCPDSNNQLPNPSVRNEGPRITAGASSFSLQDF